MPAAVHAAARAAGVRRFVHMSAVGARPEAGATPYHRTKWQAEELVRDSALPYVILRPSLINGPENAPIRTLARLHHALPVIPVFGDGRFPTQPVWIEDVALAFALGAERDELTGTFELGGPAVLTYEDFVLAIGRAAGRSHGDLRPGLPIIMGFEEIRLEIIRLVAGRGKIGRCCIKRRGFDNTDQGPFGQIRGSHILPCLAVIARDMYQTIVRACPEKPLLQW